MEKGAKKLSKMEKKHIALVNEMNDTLNSLPRWTPYVMVRRIYDRLYNQSLDMEELEKRIKNLEERK